MRDDRFGDLGPGRGQPEEEEPKPSERSAAERFAELDERDAEAEQQQQQQEQQPEAPRPSGRYSWVVGVAFFLVIVVGMVRLLASGDTDRGLTAGDRLPEFAAPLAIGPLNGDVNIRQEANQSDQAGPKPACEVDLAGALNICTLRNKPLVLSFMFTRAANCEPQLDRIEGVRREFPGTNFVGVIVREKKGRAAKIVRSNGWRFPVVFDRDGQLSNLFDVPGCPMTVFAYKGGQVNRTEFGNLSESDLRAELRVLAKGPPQTGSQTTPATTPAP